MFKKWCISHKYAVLFYIFLLAFYGYNIQRVYGFVFFPDEFGYWAYAANASGYDWSEIVSMGSYYSYGYSLILFPIFKLCKNAITAYRVAVTVNFILLGANYYLISHLLMRIPDFKHDANGKKYLPVFTGIACFYPPSLFYAKTTMVETVLTSTFLLICVLFLYYLEKNKLPTLIILIAAVVYIHFLHMRAVGVAVAMILTLLVYFASNSKKAKHLLLGAAVGAMILVAGMLCKSWLQQALYAGADAATLHINDYAGQLDKVKYLFSIDGMKDFGCGLAGKVLYLGLSSFGLFYFGMGYCLRNIWSFFKNRKQRNTSQYFSIFLFLTACGEILINTIYNIHPIRVDSVVYGRYDEFILPVFMVLGMVELLHINNIWIPTLCIIPVQAIMTVLTVFQVERYELTNIHGYVMVGMSYLHYLTPYETTLFFRMAFAFGNILMLMTIGLIRFSKKKRITYFLYIVVLIEFLLFTRASTIYIDSSNLGAYRDSIMAEKIERLVGEDDERRILFLQEDDYAFISSLQFLMREQKIEIRQANSEPELKESDIIVLNFDSAYVGKVENLYRNHMLHGRFQIFYN